MRPCTRWPRTLALFALACAALGIATTIAVAWALAAWLPHQGLTGSLWMERPPGLPRFSEPPIHVEAFSRTGMVRRHWFVDEHASIYPPSPLFMDYLPRTRLNPRESRNDHGWGNLPESVAAARLAGSWGMDDARGWPFLALWCDLDYNGAATSARGGLGISIASTGPGHFRALPLRPIWRGLLLDSALYAAAWAALLALLSTRPLRAHLRRRRGHCPACGYDLAGLPACPECGWKT